VTIRYNPDEKNNVLKNKAALMQMQRWAWTEHLKAGPFPVFQAVEEQIKWKSS
jgi:hypothetical protein